MLIMLAVRLAAVSRQRLWKTPRTLQAVSSATTRTKETADNKPKVLVLPYMPARSFSSRNWLAQAASELSAAATATAPTHPAATTTASTHSATATTASTTSPSETASTAAIPTGASEGKKELILSPDLVPERPTAISGDALDISSAIEPTLESLGLCSWWPSGRMQCFLEWLHVGCDLPWWGCILTATVCMRLCVFPLVIVAQRNAAKLANISPEMTDLQNRMTDARKRGDLMESNQLGYELQQLMKKKNINPTKNLVPMLGQVPIFMSMFFGLRGMTNLPVESLMNGGTLWFMDLTMSDQYYLLPLLTSCSLWLQFKLAADGMSMEHAGPLARSFTKIMPAALFPFIMNFPAV